MKYTQIRDWLENSEPSKKNDHDVFLLVGKQYNAFFLKFLLLFLQMCILSLAVKFCSCCPDTNFSETKLSCISMYYLKYIMFELYTDIFSASYCVRS